MDLGAYCRIDMLKDYVEKHYGIPPRLRGIRLMKMEYPIDDVDCYTEELFNKMCNKHVIYLHTRCGGYNYEEFGMDEYEKKNHCLAATDDEFDSTYRDTYLEAVVDDEYRKLLDEYYDIIQ